eukprot:scaffold6152_cov99-Isochrysis_galbana.AAC.6
MASRSGERYARSEEVAGAHPFFDERSKAGSFKYLQNRRPVFLKLVGALRVPAIDRRMRSLEYDEQRYSGGGSVPLLPCETESMRPLGAVRAPADKACDRHNRKCLEGCLKYDKGTHDQTQAHRSTAV